DGGMLCFCRNLLGGFWIPDDKISVSTRQHCTFLRIDVQNLGNVCRGDSHELVWRQTSSAHTARPQHRHTFFQTTRSIRNLGEIADAVTLLLGGECAMVGCDALQASGRKACPQTILVDLVAEWRRHHAACRIIPVLVMVFALV